jgi:hypothetical protein
VDSLWDRQGVNWRLIESSLGSIADAWAYSDDKIGATPFQPFWFGMSIGRARQRLTPDDLRETLENDRERASESALATYFLFERWDSLPEEARRALISADIEFRATGGRRGIVSDHLRSAVLIVLQEKVWRFYVDWLKNKPKMEPDELKVVNEYGSPDLVRILEHWNSQSFKGFVMGRYSKTAQNTLLAPSLLSQLWALNDAANAPRHQHRNTTSDFELSIRVQFNRILGIGHVGILDQLLRIGTD